MPCNAYCKIDGSKIAEQFWFKILKIHDCKIETNLYSHPSWSRKYALVSGYEQSNKKKYYFQWISMKLCDFFEKISCTHGQSGNGQQTKLQQPTQTSPF